MNGDMTQGNTSKILITFTIPMLLGNVFQQLYNTTDAIIVGRFVGKNALAAVGVANPCMALAISLIMGICMGMAVLMSQYFGAGEYEELKKEVSTALIGGIVFTIVLSVVCVLLSRSILLLIGTPHEILDDADIFLKIIFSGMIFSFLYNFYSAALRSVGDSKTPLIFLIISSVLNGVLCIILVAYFKMGVAGSALATVMAQGLSAILCIFYVYTKIPLIRINSNEFVLDRFLVKKTVQFSWIIAVQQSVIYLGRLLVQGVVNPFGTTTIAAFNAVTRVDAFILAPVDSFMVTVSTFSAQNTGARKPKRIIEGYIKSNLILTAYNVIVSFIIFIMAEPIMGWFVAAAEKDVIIIGVKYLKLMAVFYVLSGFCANLQGLFRGVGKIYITLIATTIQITVRVSLAYILAPYLGITSVCYGVGAGWLLMFAFDFLAYKRHFKKEQVIVT